VAYRAGAHSVTTLWGQQHEHQQSRYDDAISECPVIANDISQVFAPQDKAYRTSEKYREPGKY